MDSGTIFVLVLAFFFFAGIVYLGLLSRRTNRMEPRSNVTPLTPKAPAQEDIRRHRPAA